MNNAPSVEAAEPPRAAVPDRLRVELGERAYEIVAGRGLIERAGDEIAPLLAQPRAFIVTDENVADHWLEPLERALATAGIGTESAVLSAGESTKNFAQLETLCSRILDWRIERRSTVIALGGGVIGDLAGFAAAILMRGIEFIQVPTTVLAQVDSSVGGKTGINVAQGKNLIGAFHQPRLVLADTAALGTLPGRELGAGYAEIAKYGLLGDASFFEWLEEHGTAFFEGDDRVRKHAILESCRAKARIVGEDEKEAGNRALLNLGHTFGHALEAEAGYDGRLLHGEAVAVGMVLAFRLSAALGHVEPGDADRIAEHFRRVGIPADLGGIDTTGWTADRLLEHMRLDKKVQDGKLTFILARAVGDAFVARDVPEEAVLATLDAALNPR